MLILSSISDKTILFDEPVIVKKEDVSIFECWGASLHDFVWLIDEKGDWHELQELDLNAKEVTDALHERLVILKLQVA